MVCLVAQSSNVDKGGIVCKTIMEHHMTMEAGLDERRARLLQESSEKRGAEGAFISSASSTGTSPAAASAVSSQFPSAEEFAGEFVQRS